MKQTITALALAGVIGVASQPAAASAVATAEIDWSTFGWVLYDLDPLDSITPSITFDNQYSSVDAWSRQSASSNYSSDWVTFISAISPSAEATADANKLHAESGYGSEAGFNRGANFALSPMTLVIFRANATVFASSSAIAFAALYIQGPGANGTGWQYSSSEFYGTNSGTLTTSFLNMTNDNMFGDIGLYGSASAPVPEPENYALMLAGLGLVGWMARRRA